jgi:DNA-directed RNA polymerase subunit RPC12/RpoP
MTPRGYRLKEPHEADDICWRWHCWTHQVDEMRLAPYIVCQECGHVFQTKRALRKARRATMRGIYLDEIRHGHTWQSLWLGTRGTVSLFTRRAAHIHHCPHCAHDFA